MKVLFMLPAESIYDAQQRVMGWKQTPALRKKVQELKAIAPRLKELGVERVISSDLDNQSGWAIARALGLRCEEWHAARRFNFGKWHGLSQEKAQKELEAMGKKWESNPDIPVPNGDSLSSFKKRIAALKDKLAKEQGTAVVMLSPNEIEKLTGITAKLERGRIYEWGG